MVQLFWLPTLAALLLAIAWISTLGGGPLIVASGIVIGLIDFVIVFQAQQRQMRDDAMSR
ncbi:MAG: hypothetical protein L7U45_02945 [Alphaproteobacteria bacterium]|nr:hypothetical protein [Alphaproteobacteria bacterium]